MIVTTDRGLYADWLYKQIQSLGWHLFMRINQIGQFKQQAIESWQPLNTLVPQVGHSFQGLSLAKQNLKCWNFAYFQETYTSPQFQNYSPPNLQLQREYQFFRLSSSQTSKSPLRLQQHLNF